jgi:tetratricopeptide (TPR) repeat protein
MRTKAAKRLRASMHLLSSIATALFIGSAPLVALAQDVEVEAETPPAEGEGEGGDGEGETEAVDEADELGRTYFIAGRTAFDAGRFDEALDLFERSYRASERPELLYNIGQAADRLRQDERALDAFTRYLELVPDGENRAAVETRVRAIREAIEADRARDAALLSAHERAAQAESTRGGDDLTWLWVSLGALAAVAIGVTIVVLAMAPSQEEAEPFTGDVGPGGLVIALEGP